MTQSFVIVDNSDSPNRDLLERLRQYNWKETVRCDYVHAVGVSMAQNRLGDFQQMYCKLYNCNIIRLEPVKASYAVTYRIFYIDSQNIAITECLL